jgi:CIC family chloride channel protein
MVGMGGAVAAMTRGPLTGMMMVYELSGNYAIILPLMVTCTLASALCHVLVERRASREGAERHALRRTPVRELTVWEEPVAPELPASTLRERLLSSTAAALPVRGADGRLRGVVLAGALGERLRLVGEAATVEELLDAAPALSPEAPVAEALATMDAQAMDVLAVDGGERVGVVTRLGLERFLQGGRGKAPLHDQPFGATELR